MKILKFLASENGANAVKWAANSLINDAHKTLKIFKDLDSKDSTVQRILLGLAVCNFNESIESIQNLLNVKDEILYPVKPPEQETESPEQETESTKQETESTKAGVVVAEPSKVVGWIEPPHRFDWGGKGKDNVKPF